MPLSYAIATSWTRLGTLSLASSLLICVLTVGMLRCRSWRSRHSTISTLNGRPCPSFTVNAWGGPSYAGALACHYLDLSVLSAAAAGMLHLILLPAPASRGREVSEPAARLGSGSR